MESIQKQYTATNTSIQVIDTFDLPSCTLVEYEIKAVDANNTSSSTVYVTHDGITVSEIQRSVSSNDLRPAEFTTTISGANASVRVTPLRAPTTYYIQRTIHEANLYSESTVSGKIIKGEEGFGLYFGSANNYTVRQPNNNSFGTAVAPFGPVVTKEEFFSVEALESYNNSSLSETDGIQITPSNEYRSHHYLEIDSVPGKIYRISANAYYSFETVRSKNETIDVGARITAGTSKSAEDLGFQYISDTDVLYTIDVVASTDKLYVGFGYGSLGTVMHLSDVSVKELVPFHTYDQDQGSVYIKWNAVAAGSNVAHLGSNRIFVDGSNNIFINTANCGPQQAINKIAYTYNTEINYSKNGADVVNTAAVHSGNTKQLVFNSVVEEFSYVPVILDSTTLSGLTND